VSRGTPRPLWRAGSEEPVAVVAEEEEGDTGEVGLELGEAVAAAGEGAQRTGELGSVGAVEPFSEEGEHLDELGGVGGVDKDRAGTTAVGHGLTLDSGLTSRRCATRQPAG